MFQRIKIDVVALFLVCLGNGWAGQTNSEYVAPSYVPPPPQAAVSTDANAYRILFLGNSITRHGFNDETIKTLGWDHLSGMAASSEEKDYAHLFSAKVQETMPDRKVEIYFDNVNAMIAQDGMSDVLQGKKIPPPDLVIIQTGEHEEPGKTMEERSERYEKALIKPYLNLSPRPLIICTGVWNASDAPYGGVTREIDDAYAGICAKYQIPFVSVEAIATNPDSYGSGASPDVKWHPNDVGMQGYARVLFDAYKSQTAALQK